MSGSRSLHCISLNSMTLYSISWDYNIFIDLLSINSPLSLSFLHFLVLPDEENGDDEEFNGEFNGSVNKKAVRHDWRHSLQLINEYKVGVYI